MRPANSASKPEWVSCAQARAGQSWQVDGLDFQPAWSMSGNAAGDADALNAESPRCPAWNTTGSRGPMARVCSKKADGRV